MGYKLKMDSTGVKTIVMAGLNKAGAVTIPAEVRTAFGFRSGDKFELTANHADGVITLVPITGRCIITGDTTNLIQVNGKYLSLRVIEQLSQDIKGHSLLDFIIENAQLTESGLEELEEETLKRLEKLRTKVKDEIDEDRETVKQSQKQIQKIEVAIRDIRARKAKLAEKRKMEEEIFEEELRKAGFIREHDEIEEMDKITESAGIRTTIRSTTKVYKKVEDLNRIQEKKENKPKIVEKELETVETEEKVNGEEKSESTKEESKKKDSKKDKATTTEKKKTTKEEKKVKNINKVKDYKVVGFEKIKDDTILRIEAKNPKYGELYVKIATSNLITDDEKVTIESRNVKVLGAQKIKQGVDSHPLVKEFEDGNNILVGTEFDGVSYQMYPSRGYILKKYKK